MFSHTLSRTATPPHFSSKRRSSGSLVVIEKFDDEMETSARATHRDHGPFSKCMDAGRHTRDACDTRHACGVASRNGTVSYRNCGVVWTMEYLHFNASSSSIPTVVVEKICGS
jgi:hypothetical protein